MKATARIICILLLLILAAPACAASITDCTVSNTNVYAGSTIYSIGPAAEIDSTSTASGITNTAGQYLYASTLDTTMSGAIAQYTVSGLKGSTTIVDSLGTSQGWLWTYGDGITAQTTDLSHVFSTSGIYTTTLQLTNAIDSTGITLQDVQLDAGNWVSGNTITNTNIYASSDRLEIAPADKLDGATNTATGTTAVSGRYVYVGELSAEVDGAATTLSTYGRQGSTTISATLGTAQSWAWAFGDGATADIVGTAEHTYAAPGIYEAILTLRNYLDTTGSTATTDVSIIPPAPSVSDPTASPTQGPLSQEISLSADASGEAQADFPLTYQWQEYANSSWIDVSGATTNPVTIQISDGAETLHKFRLAVTNTAGTVYSEEVTYQSIAPPVFTAFEVSPLSGGIPLEVSFSATASDTAGYRWEYSTDGTIWVQIATGSTGSYTFANEGVYYIRVIATGTGGTTTSAVATITASNLLPEFTQISATPSAGVAPFTVTLSADATNGATFVWERQSSSSWMQIGTGSSVTYTIPSGTSVGMVYFRAIATNQYGSVTSSSVDVEVGAAPAAEITTPTAGAVFGSGKLISFAAADAGTGVSYAWDFGDGVSGAGRTASHSYAEEGFYMVTLRTSSQFGSSEDVVRIEIVESTGDIWLAVTDVSSSDVTLQATIEVSPVSSGTLVWFELESMSGTVVYKSPQLSYSSGPVSYTASGLPLMAGESYRAVAYSNYYGYSIPVMVTLVEAVQPPHEQLGNAWNDGLSREPFNVSALVAAGVGVYGGALGGGAVGAAVAFGVIVMFVLVGLWLRQQDIVIPLTLTLIAGWFVIGNLPGEWQPIAYTLMVVCVVAIFFYLFRKRIE